jgi:hypothetical protein
MVFVKQLKEPAGPVVTHTILVVPRELFAQSALYLANAAFT